MPSKFQISCHLSQLADFSPLQVMVTLIIQVTNWDFLKDFLKVSYDQGCSQPCVTFFVWLDPLQLWPCSVRLKRLKILHIILKIIITSKESRKTRLQWVIRHSIVKPLTSTDFFFFWLNITNTAIGVCTHTSIFTIRREMHCSLCG